MENRGTIAYPAHRGAGDGRSMGNGITALTERVLELFYATAIRRSGLVALKLFDMAHSRATLIVRQGKGNKDRVAPLGKGEGLARRRR